MGSDGTTARCRGPGGRAEPVHADRKQRRSGSETLSRAAAARLLAQLEHNAIQAEAAQLLAEAGEEWIHPATAERLEKCAALEDTLRRLLAIRAGSQRVPKS